jgi:hypothetical protein
MSARKNEYGEWIDSITGKKFTTLGGDPPTAGSPIEIVNGDGSKRDGWWTGQASG